MAYGAISRGEPTAIFRTEPENGVETLTGVKAVISNDGDEAVFWVSYKDRLPLCVSVFFGMMGQLSHEIRYAASLMNYRQRLKLDHGAETMQELLATALRPTSIDFHSEPGSDDRFLIFQFQESSPLVVKLKTEQLAGFVQEIYDSIARSRH